MTRYYLPPRRDVVTWHSRQLRRSTTEREAGFMLVMLIGVLVAGIAMQMAGGRI